MVVSRRNLLPPLSEMTVVQVLRPYSVSGADGRRRHSGIGMQAPACRGRPVFPLRGNIGVVCRISRFLRECAGSMLWAKVHHSAPELSSASMAASCSFFSSGDAFTSVRAWVGQVATQGGCEVSMS